MPSNQINTEKEIKFRHQYHAFLQSSRSSKQVRFDLSEKYFWRCMDDDKSNAKYDRHYLYHTAWAARKLYQTNPGLHIDLSSCLRFSSIVSAFVPIQVYDIRPPKIELDGLAFKYADITNLPFEDNAIGSLSCMHVIEHIGLGRYGDEINYDADLVSISELIRVLSVSGNLFFVVPIGAIPIIQFNAHRIYTKEQILNYFKDLTLVEFALIEQAGNSGLITDPSDDLLRKQMYACGCFWFRK